MNVFMQYAQQKDDISRNFKAFQAFSLYKLLLCNYLHKYYCINVKKVVYCLQANKQATAG